MKELNEIKKQNLTDLVCRIVEELVSNEIVKDCTDTVSQDEWDAQEIIYTHIEKHLLNI
jgi:Asp-tRNA(Asn)/Glu-tRNA(Gln) amidotransferase B subunit